MNICHAASAVLAAACLVGATPTLAQNAGDVLRIGVLTDYSGQFSGLSGPGGVIATRMAVEDAGATVLGKRVEVIEAEHGNKPDVASAIARKWFDVDGVEMIADLPNSSVALAVQGLATAAKKITMTSASGTSALTGKAAPARR